MFSALSQGSLIYLLEKTPHLKYFTGEIVGVSSPRLSYNLNMPSTVDLKVKIDDAVQEFNNLPSINSYITYNNGNLVISENKQEIQNEVESIIQNRKQILNNFDNYNEDITNGEAILKQINPQFAKDKDLDERLSKLESQFGGFESSLSEILNYVKK